jgi:hypothetical protein
MMAREPATLQELLESPRSGGTGKGMSPVCRARAKIEKRTSIFKLIN